MGGGEGLSMRGRIEGGSKGEGKRRRARGGGHQTAEIYAMMERARQRGGRRAEGGGRRGSQA